MDLAMSNDQGSAFFPHPGGDHSAGAAMLESSARAPGWQPLKRPGDAETRAFEESNSMPAVMQDVARLLLSTALIWAAIRLGFWLFGGH
jgi:hypothetical protein